MKYEIFLNLYREAVGSNDFDMYVAERGWQSWMDDYSDTSKLTDILSAIYDVAKSKNPIEELKNISNLSYSALANNYAIPLRSIQNWSSTAPNATRKPPTYLIPLLTYAILSDMDII